MGKKQGFLRSVVHPLRSGNKKGAQRLLLFRWKDESPSGAGADQ
jgi:hypothetical protein